MGKRLAFIFLVMVTGDVLARSKNLKRICVFSLFPPFYVQEAENRLAFDVYVVYIYASRHIFLNNILEDIISFLFQCLCSRNPTPN